MPLSDTILKILTATLSEYDFRGHGVRTAVYEDHKGTDQAWFPFRALTDFGNGPHVGASLVSSLGHTGSHRVQQACPRAEQDPPMLA
jgi:hypothetical protein